MTANTPKKRDVPVTVPGADPETKAPIDSDTAKREPEVKAMAENADITAQRLNKIAAEEDTQLSPNGITPAVPFDVDREAMLSELREQARQEARAELADQIKAAVKVADQPPAKLSRVDYRKMHADEIDHTTLTAPVQTLDGWLCPPAPTK